MHRTGRRLVTRLALVIAMPLLLFTLMMLFAAASMLSMSDAEWPTTMMARPAEVLPHPQQQQGPSHQCPDEQHDLLKQLDTLKKLVTHLEDRLRKQQQETTRHESRNDMPCSSKYIQKQIDQSELQRGKRWHSEYEIIPHSFFTLNAFYATETGMGRRVVERPIGSRRQDLQEAVSSALSILNSRHENSNIRYVAHDFVEGLYRIDPIEGTQYELWFRRNKASIDNSSSLIKVALLKPHAPIAAVKLDDSHDKSPIVNVIVPLSGRLKAFQSFLQRFHKNVLSSTRHQMDVHLTIVVFGDDEWPDVRKEVLEFEKVSHFSNFHLLNINGTFSRARGLQAGVDHWEGSQDVIVFFCDVDVDFDHVFIDRCRRNTVRKSMETLKFICRWLCRRTALISKRQVYFPIVFSQFNPNVTRQLSPPSHHNNKERLHKDAGFWRDFGFGMLCTYRSDFLALGGFRGGDATSGWGGEDLFLYRKFIRSPVRIVRSPDPNLVHLWHVKHCPQSLSPAQRRACLQSKGRNEASYDQLALLLFAKN